jgi:putative FmdB family regulatory protein
MPTYEYTCEECGALWELMHSAIQEPLKDCPRGHTGKAKRLISGGTGFQLTGDTWAKDGYGKRTVG